MSDKMTQLLENPAVAKTTAGATVTVGVVADWLPDWLQTPADFAAVVGIVLSVVLIVSNVRKMINDNKLDKLQAEKLRLEIFKMKDEE